jgi:hypothetical protein
LGIAVALVVLVGAAGVAIRANGGQDKSQRSGATSRGTEGSDVTIINNSRFTLLVRNSQAAYQREAYTVLEMLSCDQESIPSNKYGGATLARKALPDLGALCRTEYKSTSTSMTDIELQFSTCETSKWVLTVGCGGDIQRTRLRFDSNSLIGVGRATVYMADRNNNLQIVWNPLSQNPKTLSNQYGVEGLKVDLQYNGQATSTSKNRYTITFSDA